MPIGSIKGHGAYHLSRHFLIIDGAGSVKGSQELKDQDRLLSRLPRIKPARGCKATITNTKYLAQHLDCIATISHNNDIVQIGRTNKTSDQKSPTKHNGKEEEKSKVGSL
jgi:hypothetical protein